MSILELDAKGVPTLQLPRNAYEAERYLAMEAIRWSDLRQAPSVYLYARSRRYWTVTLGDLLNKSVVHIPIDTRDVDPLERILRDHPVTNRNMEVRVLYHGTDFANLEPIRRSGLVVRPSSSGGMLGASSVYFGDFLKAFRYAMHGPHWEPRRIDHEHGLIVRALVVVPCATKFPRDSRCACDKCKYRIAAAAERITDPLKRAEVLEKEMAFARASDHFALWTEETPVADLAPSLDLPDGRRIKIAARGETAVSDPSLIRIVDFFQADLCTRSKPHEPYDSSVNYHRVF